MKISKTLMHHKYRKHWGIDNIDVLKISMYKKNKKYENIENNAASKILIYWISIYW